MICASAPLTAHRGSSRRTSLSGPGRPGSTRWRLRSGSDKPHVRDRRRARNAGVHLQGARRRHPREPAHCPPRRPGVRASPDTRCRGYPSAKLADPEATRPVLPGTGHIRRVYSGRGVVSHARHYVALPSSQAQRSCRGHSVRLRCRPATEESVDVCCASSGMTPECARCRTGVILLV